MTRSRGTGFHAGVLLLLLAGAVIPAPAGAQVIRGQVLAQGSETPIARATVALLDGALSTIATTRTDTVGAFTFGRLAPGRYLLQADRGGVQSALSAPVEVEGDTALVTLEMPSPLIVLALTCGPPLDPAAVSTVLVGTAHDHDTGVALPNAPLELSWAGGSALATADAAGNFRFCDAPVGLPLRLSTAIWGREATTELTLSAAPVNLADFAISVGTVQLSVIVTGRRPAAIGAGALVATLRDAATGVPLTAAGAAIGGSPVLIPASERGMVRFAGLPPGSHDLVVDQVGYGRRVVEVVITAGEELHVEVRIPAQPIALDPIGVRAEPISERSTPRTATTRVDVIAGAQMAFAEQRAARVVDIVRQRFPGLHVSEGAFSTVDSPGLETIVCVESVRRLARLMPPDGVGEPYCEMVVVIIDGVPTFNGGAALRGMHAGELESMEYLGPLDAGGRYGTRAGQTGALLLWTRGRGPYQTPSRNPPPGGDIVDP